MKISFVVLLALIAVAANAVADPMTQSVQQKLKDQGFYYGTVDGSPGAETTAAIKRFQIRNGLSVTGEADLATVEALGVAGKGAYTKTAPQIKDAYRTDREFLRKEENT